MEYVLGIDIGTGGVKAVAVNLRYRSFEICRHDYSFKTLKPGYHEQDPEEIWNAFKISLRQIINKIGAQPLAIGLSTAMHSLIPVDKNGDALAPMMTWADHRSSAIAERLSVSDEGLSIYRFTGTPLHAMSPLCKIIWIRAHDTELFQKTHKFISIKEYIWYKLFKEFKIDHSIASCTGLFDIYKRIWHAESLAVACIDEQLLSVPVATDYFKLSAKHSDLDFLESGIPFVIGASDGCLANLGSMAVKKGAGVMTIGTSGAVRITSQEPLPNVHAMTFSYILDKENYICGGPINNGGIALQWWLKQHMDRTPGSFDYEQIFRQISEIPAGAEGLLFLPYLTGERAPIWDSESCGVFFGIKLHHKQAHFSKAVLEGVCFAMRNVLDAVEQNDGSIDEIYINGGFVRSEIWVQMLADIIGKKVIIVQTEDASATGAAFLTMRAIGLIDKYPVNEDLNLKIIVPNPGNTALYSRNFSIFKKLYSNLKETMHELHGITEINIPNT